MNIKEDILPGELLVILSPVWVLAQIGQPGIPNNDTLRLSPPCGPYGEAPIEEWKKPLGRIRDKKRKEGSKN